MKARFVTHLLLPTLLLQNVASDYLYIRDMCDTSLVDLSQLYSRGIIQTPSAADNLYPLSAVCTVTVYTLGLSVFIKLDKFSIPVEFNGSCSDYILLNEQLTLCGPAMQGLFIPLPTIGSIQISFRSNDKSASGARLSFQSLPEQTGIFGLCDSMQTFRKDTTLTDFGYITTPLYPLPLTAPVNCSTIFIVPHGCHYLRLWFLDFVIDSSNYLVVSSVPYSGKLSGSSAILDVGGDSITMGIQFVKMTRASAQRIALMYRCLTRGWYHRMTANSTSRLPSTAERVYITGSRSSVATDLLSTHSPVPNFYSQTLEVATEPNQLSLFCLLSWNPKVKTNNHTQQPFTLMVNGLSMSSAGQYYVLTTHTHMYTVSMATDLTAEHHDYEFILLYQGHVDGVYDICQHSKILAMGVGYVVSPNYPNPYSNQLNCSLTLSTTQSRAMELAIIDFETEGASVLGYDHDYLLLTNPKDQSSRKLAGQQPIPYADIRSAGDSVQLTFISDGATGMRGFMIQYKVCEPSATTTKETALGEWRTETSKHLETSTRLVSPTAGPVVTASSTRSELSVSTMAGVGSADAGLSRLMALLACGIAATCLLVLCAIGAAVCIRRKIRAATSYEDVVQIAASPSRRVHHLLSGVQRSVSDASFDSHQQNPIFNIRHGGQPSNGGQCETLRVPRDEELQSRRNSREIGTQCELATPEQTLSSSGTSSSRSTDLIVSEHSAFRPIQWADGPEVESRHDSECVSVADVKRKEIHSMLMKQVKERVKVDSPFDRGEFQIEQGISVEDKSAENPGIASRHQLTCTNQVQDYQLDVTLPRTFPPPPLTPAPLPPLSAAQLLPVSPPLPPPLFSPSPQNLPLPLASRETAVIRDGNTISLRRPQYSTGSNAESTWTEMSDGRRRFRPHIE